MGRIEIQGQNGNHDGKTEEIFEEEITFVTQLIEKAYALAKQKGYEIYIPVYENADNVGYFHYGKDGYYAYCGLNNYDLLHLATVHRANKTTGTGWMVEDNMGDISAEEMENALETSRRNIVSGNEYPVNLERVRRVVDKEKEQ